MQMVALPFQDPVVIALTATQREKHACIVQVKDVAVGKFKIRCTEPSNLGADQHVDDSVAWYGVDFGLRAHYFKGILICWRKLIC